MDLMHVRKTVRAKWDNYSNGFYFITVVTQNRKHYFGSITDSVMHLSPIGEYLKYQIENISSHHPYAKILNYVVMPNHFHVILQIMNDAVPSERRNLYSLNNKIPSRVEAKNDQGWVSVVIGGIKSYVTRYAHQSGFEFGWQVRFHEHIIRNTEDMENINTYISTNVLKWDNDCFHPGNESKF